MRAITVAVLAAIALSACGGEDDMRGMFGNNSVIIAKTLDVPAGKKVQVFQAQVPDGESEFVTLTLSPPTVPNAAPEFNGFEMKPLLGLFAIVEFGNGQQARAQVEVDFGSGVSFPLRGSTIRIEAFNTSSTDATQVGAFLSRGAFAAGTPRRTVVVKAVNGNPISASNSLAPSAVSLPQPLPPFSKNVSTLVKSANLLTVVTYGVGFYDVNGGVISLTQFTTEEAVALPVPADAYRIQLVNLGGDDIVAARYVFDLNI